VPLHAPPALYEEKSSVIRPGCCLARRIGGLWVGRHNVKEGKALGERRVGGVEGGGETCNRWGGKGREPVSGPEGSSENLKEEKSKVQLDGG